MDKFDSQQQKIQDSYTELRVVKSKYITFERNIFEDKMAETKKIIIDSKNKIQ